MERLTELFERLKKIDLSFLEIKMKEFDLEEISQIFITMYENYLKLENEPDFFNPLPETNKVTINSNFSTFVEITEETKNFDLQRAPNQERKDKLIVRITDSYQNSYNFIRDFRIYFVEKGFRKFKRIKSQS